MEKKLSAPIIDRKIAMLHRIPYRHLNDGSCYDEKSNALLSEVFELLKQIKPTGRNGVRTLWFHAPRGSIKDYGNYREMKDWGDVGSYQEFVEMWKDEYPNDTSWYEFSAVEDPEIQYRMIFLNNQFVIELDPRKEICEYERYDIADLSQWLLDSTKECIDQLKKGTYNDIVAPAIPPGLKTGTILRKDLWDIFPEAREEFYKDISPEDVQEFIEKASAQPEDVESLAGSIENPTANDFYRYCALGYAENHYDGIEKTPKEQYYLHADGLDEGLSEIDPDSPEAFHRWYHDERHRGGHPWEVCRGGNSTHVALQLSDYKNGWHLYLAGSSEGRTIETVKFYLALTRAGVPVFLEDAKELVLRMQEKERIGIVPEGVFPRYCESHFPNDRIIDFMNLPFENREEVVAKTEWQPYAPVRLMKE